MNPLSLLLVVEVVFVDSLLGKVVPVPVLESGVFLFLNKSFVSPTTEVDAESVVVVASGFDVSIPADTGLSQLCLFPDYAS